MIQSIWQIDFTNPAGTHRLLDYGDLIADEVRFSVAQQAAQYAPIGAAWGETDAGLSAYVTLGWERRQSHASHAAARTHALRTAASTTLRQTGTLRIAVDGGETWDIEDCTITASDPLPVVGYGFRTLTAYQAIGGRMTPAAEIALTVGMPWDWTLQNWEDVTTNWENL